MRRIAKNRLAAVLAAMGVVATSAYAVRAAQESGPGNLVILDFKPSFADLMNMLIQPRHIKLYYAGQEENWPLARFQLNEMRAAFGRIEETIPNYSFFPVGEAVETVIAGPMDEVQAAIDAGDPAAFERAYVTLTGACNACHEAMNFPILVMKVPDAADAAAFADQDFRPQQGP